jgi:DNA-binding IclR family transcriptional regulator
LRGGDVVYLEKLAPRGGRLVTPSVIGDRMPAACTGVGKALLAFASADVAEELGDQPVDGALGQANLSSELGERGLPLGMINEDLQDLKRLVDRGTTRVG